MKKQLVNKQTSKRVNEINEVSMSKFKESIRPYWLKGNHYSPGTSFKYERFIDTEWQVIKLLNEVLFKQQFCFDFRNCVNQCESIKVRIDQCESIWKAIWTINQYESIWIDQYELQWLICSTRPLWLIYLHIWVE